MESVLPLLAAILLVAALYSSVGHGGASGYLAVMALFAIEQSVARPTALMLNLFVASIATFLFHRAGHFDWKVFNPFAVASVPMAFLGGMVQLSGPAYRGILGAVLVAAAVRLAWNLTNDREPVAPKWMPALLAGGAIGLVSGLVGVGGGIFLTPLLLLANWSDTKTAAGVSALFILVNSAAGLAGGYDQLKELSPIMFGFVGVAVVGGLVGSALGSRHLSPMSLRRILAVVLIVAAAKFVSW